VTTVRVTDAVLVERRELAPRQVLLWLSAPDVSRVAQPGQFVMVLPGLTLDPFLPRPLWIHRMRDTERGEEMALLVEVAGRGTSLIAAAVPGQHLRITGPLGRPVPLVRGARQLLLLGEGTATAPLVWLSDEESQRGRGVALILVPGADHSTYPLGLLRPEIEVVVAGGDAGEAAPPLTALLPEYAVWADQILASGPQRLYADLRETLRPLPFRRPCHVLLAPPMPCGTGVCGGCPVTTRRRGMRLACRDGPVFELRDLP
jgi:dihydroorotate dehydrogenase electron transfer subunit